MSRPPLVSVIVPVYNSAKYLPRCLDSILGQSFRDFEVICVDGGSTDNSSEILFRYAESDTRIRIITQQCRGLSAARNAGMETAQGEWISFVDSDDELTREAFAHIAPCLSREVDVVCFEAEEIVEENGRTSIRESGYFSLPGEGQTKLDERMIFKICWTVWNKFFRSSFIKQYGLTFPEGCRYEDNPFTLNSFAVCGNVFLLKKKLYRYFRHPGSLSTLANRGDRRSAFDYLRILDHMHEFWKKHQLLPEKLPLFQNICVRMFRSAIQVCLPYEKAGIVMEMTNFLQSWELALDDPHLKQIRDGDYTIRLGRGWHSTDVEMMKKLKGLQRIFYLGNSRDCKVLLLFGLCVLRWKKRCRRIL